MNDIDVKRARVRALAWRLINNPPSDFDLTQGSHCAIHVASGMPTFIAVGTCPRDDDGNGIIEFFGLSPRYFCYPPRLGAIQEYANGRYARPNKDARRMGILYLEAIGDCGPPEPAAATAQCRGEDVAQLEMEHGA